MKVVDSIVGASVPRIPVVRNISLGEEVHNVAASIYDRSPDDANVIGDICASNIRLQEWRMDLSRVDEIAGLGI